MIIQPTTPDINGIHLIQGFERCVFKAYLPTKADKPTIGWGTTGPDIHLGMVWVQAQCDARFASDLNRFAASVTGLLNGGAATTEDQFNALVSFAYNEGAGALHGSTLLALHRAGNYALAAQQFPKWNTQNHVVLNGLIARRAAEQKLYLTPSSGPA